MAISEIEKQQLAQLNQSRLKVKQKSENSNGLIQGISPTTFINIGEMVIILGAALTVDAIDILDLTGVGAILVRLIDIPTLGALWLWRILKHQTGPKKDPTFLLLSAFLVELSPAGMIPTWTIFVIYIYFQDTKLGKKTVGKVQKITKLKKPK
ncbi:hypothetical protein ES703_29409 [subsurface metagenome]